MILYEAFEYTFSSPTDLFPYFYAPDEADNIFFKIMKRYKKTILRKAERKIDMERQLEANFKNVSRQKGSTNHRQEPLVLGRDTNKTVGVKELADQLEYVFQTKVRRTEILHLKNGQDFSDFKKQTEQYSFICLLGARREISLHSKGGKKRRVFSLGHGDVLYLSDNTTLKNSKGVRRSSDATSETLIVTFYCERPFSVDI